MENVPEEILEHILFYLSPTKELQCASKVCREWRKLCSDIYTFKIQTFKEECKKGRLVWRDCSNKPMKRAHHFVPKHMKPHSGRENTAVPSPRVYHGATSYDGCMYVFGGCSIDELATYPPRRSYFNDLHKYDILVNKWEKVRTIGMPSPRQLFSLTRYKDNIVICGGDIGSDSAIRPFVQKFDDIYVYNITKNCWYKSGTLQSPRSAHQATCLRDKLVVFGGMSDSSQMCERLEVCSFTDNADNTLSCTSSAVPYSTPEQVTIGRFHHLQAKLDDHRILVYGGQCISTSEGLQAIRRCDGWVLHFDQTYQSVQVSKLVVENMGCYKGMYQAQDHSGARVGNSIVFVNRPIYIKLDPEIADVYTVDTNRKPSCDLIYQHDYYHTFVLDIEHAVTQHTVTWCPVHQNPQKYAPRNSIFHTVTCLGDSLYVFGGAVENKMTKQDMGSNNLYKVNVRRTICKT